MSVDGLLVVDKPIGPTSHDVVARARRLLGERRIGHTGTLDPLASGVLALVVGRATRLARFLTAADKTYEAVLRLGWSTDTADAQGEPTSTRHDGPWPDRAAIEEQLGSFLGRRFQQPPAYSAKKIDGERSHRLARQGRADLAQPAPVEVSAFDLQLVGIDGPLLTLTVRCSAGFYVRSLAHDLGERLGVGAHLTALRRTASGRIGLDQARRLDALEATGREAACAAILPMETMLPDHPAVLLTDEGVTRVRHGRDLGAESFSPIGSAGDVPAPRTPEVSDPPPVRLMTDRGELLGLGVRVGVLLHPAVVLV